MFAALTWWNPMRACCTCSPTLASHTWESNPKAHCSSNFYFMKSVEQRLYCAPTEKCATGPPRIPPSQGYEHLSVMPLFRKCYVPKKKITKILWRMRQIFIEFHLVFESGISYKKINQVLHWFRTEISLLQRLGVGIGLLKSCYIPEVDELILTRLDL